MLFRKIAKSGPGKFGSRAAAGRPFPGKVNAQIASSRFYCGVLRAISEESPGGAPRTVAIGRGARRNLRFNSYPKGGPQIGRGHALFQLFLGRWVEIQLRRLGATVGPRVFASEKDGIPLLLGWKSRAEIPIQPTLMYLVG